MYISEMQQQIHKKPFVSDIMAFEIVAAISA